MCPAQAAAVLIGLAVIADYNWRTDTIRLPLPGQFRTPQGCLVR